jgi:septum formation protein
MKPFAEQELHEYLAGEAWIGKAGAFGYQDRTGWLEILEGSESNVVGLPMELLERRLREFDGGLTE